MSFVNSQFTLSDAVNFGYDTWDLYLSNWGNTVVDVANSVVFPEVGQRGMPTIAGIAIGPQSEVDRCFVAYDIQKNIPEAISWDQARRLSLGSPLMYPQAGSGQKVNGTTPGTGDATLAIYPRTNTVGDTANGYMPWTTYGDTYQAINGSGQALTYNAGGVTAIAPSALLHLVVYLKPPLHGASTKRAPWRRNFVHTGAFDTSEGRWIIAPAFGRKRLKLFGRGPAAFKWRLTGVLAGANPHREFPIADSGSTSVTADTMFANQVSDLMGADFVIVYVTPDAGGAGTFNFTLQVDDD